MQILCRAAILYVVNRVSKNFNNRGRVSLQQLCVISTRTPLSFYDHSREFLFGAVVCLKPIMSYPRFNITYVNSISFELLYSAVEKRDKCTTLLFLKRTTANDSRLSSGANEYFVSLLLTVDCGHSYIRFHINCSTSSSAPTSTSSPPSSSMSGYRLNCQTNGLLLLHLQRSKTYT